MTETQTGIPGNPDPWWESGALKAIQTLAANGQEFTAADVADLVPPPDHSCRWGSVMAKARAMGLIQRVGYAPSRTSGRNGGVAAVWRAA